MSTPSRKYFDQLPKNVQENLTNNICSYDTNKDGILSREEFKNVLDAIGETTVSDEEVEDYMREFDLNKDGTLTVEEAIEVASKTLLDNQ